jgi:DNA-binding NtrC family response regulator
MTKQRDGTFDMGKKKSQRVLIVANNPELSSLVEGNESTLRGNQTRVNSYEEALEIASKEATYFDFLITDLESPNVKGEDFAKQFIKLSPSTKVVYIIP